MTKIYEQLRTLNSNITGLVASIFQTGTMESDYTGWTGTVQNIEQWGSNSGIGFWDNYSNWIGKNF